MPQLTPGFFQQMASLVLTLPVSQTNLFLEPNAKLPQTPNALTRIIRCRLETQPPACDYMFLDGNQLSSLDCTGVYLLSASMNPILEVFPGSKLRALNLSYTRVAAFDCALFPQIVSLSLKGCIYLRSFDAASTSLRFLDVRETRFSFGLRARYGANVLLGTGTEPEEASVVSSTAVAGRCNRIWFEQLEETLSVEPLDSKASRLICGIGGDLRALELIAATNERETYINSQEAEAMRELEENMRQMVEMESEMREEWRDIVRKLEFRYFTRDLPARVRADSGSVEITEENKLCYAITNAALKSGALQLVFEGVEVQEKTVIFDPQVCRDYRDGHISRIFVKIANMSAVRLACDGYIADSPIDDIEGNSVVTNELENSIECDVYHAETLGLYIYVPVRIHLSDEIFHIEDLAEERRQLENKYCALFNESFHEPQAILDNISLEEILAQRLALSGVKMLNLHACGLSDADILEELLESLPDLQGVDISFNELQRFALKSGKVNDLQLEGNKISKIELDCPSLRSLDLEENCLQFIFIFTGLTHKTKLALEHLNLQNNGFDPHEFRIIPALCRHLKNLKSVNRIPVAAISPDKFTGICNYNSFNSSDNVVLCTLVVPESHQLADLSDQFFLAPPAALLNLPGLDSVDCSFCSFFQAHFLQKYAFSLKSVDLSYTAISQQQFDALQLPECESLLVLGNDVHVPRALASRLLSLGADYVDNLLSPCCIPQLTSLFIPNADVEPRELLELRALRVLFAPFSAIPELLYLLGGIEFFNDTFIPQIERKMHFQRLTQHISAALLEARPVANGALDLSNLQIRSLAADERVLGELAAVRRLAFDGNALATLEGLDSSFPALEWASARQNCIEAPFAARVNCAELRHLDLSGNPARSVKNEEFYAPRLQSLRFQKTLVKTLNPMAFAFLPALQALDISNNSFLTASKETMEGLPNLRTLNVRGSCRNSLEIALRARAHIAYFDCESCRIASIQTVTWFCEKATHLRAIKCANNPFCTSYIKQGKTYIFDVLEANLQLEQIDSYIVKETDVQRIAREREERAAAKEDEMEQLIMGAHPDARKRNSSASARRHGESEKPERPKLLDANGMRVCGVLPRVSKE